MGVDFIAYSNVIIKPIPEKYRSKKIKQDFILNQIEKIDEKYLTLYLMANGISYDKDNEEYIIPEEIEITDEQYKYEEQLKDNNEDFIYINFHNNKMYYKSSETELRYASISYSNYFEFIEECKKTLKRDLKYVVPSTDTATDNGVVSNEINIKNLYNDLTIIDKVINKDDEDLWFFKDYYELVKCANNNGIIYIN